MNPRAGRALFAVLLLGVCTCACIPKSALVARLGAVQVVMSPDRNAFAFSLDVYPYWAPGPDAWNSADFGLWPFTEIWKYDFRSGRGPRRIAHWTHGRKMSARLIAWSKSGMYVHYRGHNGTQKVERLDPLTGWRFPVGRIPDEALKDRILGRPAPGDAEDESPGIAAVEERFGEFFLWDPVQREKVLLFALPLEHNGIADMDRNAKLKSRATALRDDGIHDLWQVKVTPTGNGTMFRFVTFAKRPATLSRQYVVHSDVGAPDPSREVLSEYSDVNVTLIDTLVTLGPQGTTFDIFVPDSLIRQALYPYRRSERLLNVPFSAPVFSYLRPKPLAGEGRIPTGILNGNVTLAWNHMEVPRRAIPPGAKIPKASASGAR